MSLFGLVIPGRPLRVDWVQVDATKWTMEIPNAELISELCVFIADLSQIPPHLGAGIHASLPPTYDAWELVGAVTVHRPSDVFRVAWSKRELPPNTPIRLGLSLEPLETLAMQKPPLAAAENARNFTKGIAMDLFNFLQSHSDQIGPVWQNVLDKWFKRVEEKLQHDPMFWRKNLKEYTEE